MIATQKPQGKLFAAGRIAARTTKSRPMPHEEHDVYNTTLRQRAREIVREAVVAAVREHARRGNSYLSRALAREALDLGAEAYLVHEATAAQVHVAPASSSGGQDDAFVAAVLIDALEQARTTNDVLTHLHRATRSAHAAAETQRAEALDALCTRLVRAWVGSWPEQEVRP